MKDGKVYCLIDWTNTHVVSWISEFLKFPQYKESFLNHEVSGRDLIDLTEDNLKYDLQIIKLHDRKKILREICILMKEYVTSCEKQLQQLNNNDIENEIAILYEGTKNLFWKFKITNETILYDLIQETSKYFVFDNK